MTSTQTMKITIYARVGNGDVLNILGSAERDVEVQIITPENRRPGDAPGATMRIFDTGMASVLRELAGRIDR